LVRYESQSDFDEMEMVDEEVEWMMKGNEEE